MQLITTYLCSALILVTAFSSASGQAGEKLRETRQDTNKAITQTREPDAQKDEAALPDEPPTWIYLVGGRRIQVDEVTESEGGFWYKLGNISTFVDGARVERIERRAEPKLTSLPDTFEGSGKWNISDSTRVESYFMSRFKRPLPLTAFGQSELHTRWGLDHRNGMDVGLHPDSLEGNALIKFLLSEEIPFLAFRDAVPGVATGPHIHIGNGSHRLRSRQ